MNRVKICGLKSKEDIDVVNRVLPDYIGFVFAESRRQISKKAAEALKARLDTRITAVGVFVDQDIDTVVRLCRSGVIDMVQLHGDEDSSYIKELRNGYKTPIIKAVSIAERLPDVPVQADYILFDTKSTRRGGTGLSFDWNLLKEYRGQPYFLAGGLHASNIVEALTMLRPFCVDISSGVETDGKKDAYKIATLVREVRKAGTAHRRKEFR